MIKMAMENWKPKTELGKRVMEGSVASIDMIFSSGKKIKESEIVDRLLPNMQSEVILIGGSPGKGGGIKRTPTRRTARMHRSGRRFRISAMVVIGNGDGYIGVGKAQALEHRDAIEKATHEAKLNVIPVKRGCGSWECACGTSHSIPAEARGKSGSVTVVLKPAPRGLGLAAADEGKKVLQLAGIRDIWSKSYGNTRARINYVLAILSAFKKLNAMKVHAAGEKEQEEENESETGKNGTKEAAEAGTKEASEAE
ncbi:MAG: 30S ribosomal protein S5 [Candidatus Aenigmarchaeota archaeon]|nr:30S ribosomal protein S5 [Candidatus Aenigmarchaeota archaeon]